MKSSESRWVWVAGGVVFAILVLTWSHFAKSPTPLQAHASEPVLYEPDEDQPDEPDEGVGPQPQRATPEVVLPHSRAEVRSRPGSGTLPSVRLTSGWATFGQVLPEGVATHGLQFGNLMTQTDVKTRWPDGSIRFAVVTVRAPQAGLYQAVAAPASGPAYVPARPAVRVRFRIGMATWTATLPEKGCSNRWLSGPLVTEWRTTIVPSRPGGQRHPSLRVLLDIRVYNDGQARLDVTVETTLNESKASAVGYDVDLVASGKTLFRRKGVTHGYLTRWRKVFPLGLTESAVTPDFEPFYQARALPRYLSQVENVVSAPTGPGFDILHPGALNPYMPSPGRRPEVAPYPDWTARYLVHKNPTQRKYVLANGDQSGSWPVHLREVAGDPHKGLGVGRLISIDERPNFWLDHRATPGNRPAGNLAATGPLTPDNAHQPSLAYVPYLLTGDRYYADEMRFWANYALLATRTEPSAPTRWRAGQQGILGPNEVSGIAWALRNMADAAAYLPSGDPIRAYLAQKVRNNLTWLDNYTASHTAPLGTRWEDRRGDGDSSGSNLLITTWEQNALAWAIDHANQQGFAGGARHRDRITAFGLSLFGDLAYRGYAGMGTIRVGNRGAGGAIQLYRTLHQLGAGNGWKPGGVGMPFAGYHGAEARLALLIARRNQSPGAENAYQHVHSQIGVDLATRAGWAIDADSIPPRP